MSDYYFEDDSGATRVVAVSDGDHAARGRCSGIPECCITHYEAGGEPTVDWGYVACPTCVVGGNRVTVRDCADNDGAACTCGAWANSTVVVDAPNFDCACCGLRFDYPADKLYDDDERLECRDCHAQNVVTIDEDDGARIGRYVCCHGKGDDEACEPCETAAGVP